MGAEANVASAHQKAQSNVKKSYHSKFIILCIFLVVDIALNSTLDYDSHPESDSLVLSGLFGAQIICQITVFLILFLAAADTFLFQVGLLGILMRDISFTLVLQLVYFAITMVLGAFRSQQFRSGSSQLEILDDSTIFTLSIAQKIVSIPYYVANLQSTVRLEDPIYFNRDAWISLIQQMRKQQ